VPAVAALFYRQIVTTVVEVSSPKVAELAKLYENVFRNVNIALAQRVLPDVPAPGREHP